MKHISTGRAKLPMAVQLARFGLVAEGALLFAVLLLADFGAGSQYPHPEFLPIGAALLIVPAAVAIALGKMGMIARVIAEMLGWFGLVLSVLVGLEALAGGLTYVSPGQPDPVGALLTLPPLSLSLLILYGVQVSKPALEAFRGAERVRWNRSLYSRFGLVIAGSSDGAVRITEVALGGVSDAAGLRAGDGIVAIDGRPVWTSEQVVFVLKNIPRRQPIQLSLRASDGVAREVQVSETQPAS